MPEKQLHLFPFPRPLLERFGEDFFRKIPRVPGVYIMTGAGERVLYIGQSGNLRNRLARYKNALPDRASRKTVRLVRLVEHICWETCPSPTEARLRENELLRLHRPRFNRLNTYPRAYAFISLRCLERRIELRRATHPEAATDVYGAFKSRVLSGYGALVRLTWAALNNAPSPLAFPRHLLTAKPPASFTLDLKDCELETRLADLLRRFLSGSDNALCEWLNQRVGNSPAWSPFERAFYEENLSALQLFYLSGPSRNRRLTQTNHLSKPTIPQPVLDDLLAMGPDPSGRPGSRIPAA